MKYDYNTNIIILGESYSGKTTFINNYLNKRIFTPTIGVDFHKTKFEHNSNQYLIRIWDTGAGLRYKNILTEYLNKSLIYVIIQNNKTTDFIYNVLNLQLHNSPKYIIIIYNINNENDINFKYNETEIINKYSQFKFSFIYINILDKSQVITTFNILKNIIIHHYNQQNIKLNIDVNIPKEKICFRCCNIS